MTRLAPAALLLTLPLLAAGCTSEPSPGSDDADARLSVVLTVAPITSIVANIAGDRARITGIVPEGTNSHTFEPPPQVSAVMARGQALRRAGGLDDHVEAGAPVPLAGVVR